MSNFEEDLLAEKIVGEYLDKNFYPNIPLIFEERITDLERQYKGIDVIASFNGKNLFIDEKAVTSFDYKNIDDLKTFSLELSFLNQYSNVSKGWFLNKDKLTTHYLFCWLDRSNKKKFITDIKDIFNIEIALVSRKSLIEYIEDTYGYTVDSLLEKSEIMRKEGKTFEKLNGLTRFHLSTKYKEYPLNLLLSKREIQSLALIFNKF